MNEVTAVKKRTVKLLSPTLDYGFPTAEEVENTNSNYYFDLFGDVARERYKDKKFSNVEIKEDDGYIVINGKCCYVIDPFSSENDAFEVREFEVIYKKSPTVEFPDRVIGYCEYELKDDIACTMIHAEATHLTYEMFRCIYGDINRELIQNEKVNYVVDNLSDYFCRNGIIDEQIRNEVKFRTTGVEWLRTLGIFSSNENLGIVGRLKEICIGQARYLDKIVAIEELESDNPDSAKLIDEAIIKFVDELNNSREFSGESLDLILIEKRNLLGFRGRIASYNRGFDELEANY